MNHAKGASSLRWQMTAMMLTAWLVPVALVLCVMGWYISDSLSTRTAQNLSHQFQANVRMCADRLSSAVEASRLASYSPDITDAWTDYQNGGPYSTLYWSSRAFLNQQYRADSRFRFAVLWFSDNPDRQGLATFSEGNGEGFAQVSRYWQNDHQAVKEFANGLNTSVGFLERNGQIYLVRNLIGSRYETMGTLAMALNNSYYFEGLSTATWVEQLTISFNESLHIPLAGARVTPADLGLEGGFSSLLWGRDGNALYERVAGKGYSFSALATVDLNVLLSQSSGYKWLLFSMVVLLVPLLLVVFRFFRRKISAPIEAMMEGAKEIEAGKLGHQLPYRADSLEFRYLTESFNHMSGRLQSQFDRIYQEELALRDARIKALQSHINPHFLNNTLEIINWEARMNGDSKVSKMIEDLSTVLDAAIDRDKRPEIRLAEEMVYVNAYLHIIMERFGKRLSVTVDMPEALMNYMVPRLILQPVIENAVEHGIGPGGYGSITLRGRLSDGLLLLDTENDGGLSAEDEALIAALLSPDYDTMKKACRSVGIANVNQRLRILYGEQSGLRITSIGDNRVLARISIATKRES